jgi:hypothetical protein
MPRRSIRHYDYFHLWVEEGELREVGVITDCFIEGNIITFVVGKREYSFYLQRADKPKSSIMFWGDGPRRAVLTLPSAV